MRLCIIDNFMLPLQKNKFVAYAAIKRQIY